MNIQIVAPEGGNSSSTYLTYKSEYLYIYTRKLYNKANLFHMYTLEHASNNTDLSIFSLRLHIEKDI